MNALNLLCAQLTRDLSAIAKFLLQFLANVISRDSNKSSASAEVADRNVTWYVL